MVETSKTKKAVYTRPRLVEHGTVEQLTRGFATGNYIDADFPAGTPVNQVTFS
jgi:hypothetical protein